MAGFRKQFLFLWCSFMLTHLCCYSQQREQPYVVMISLDGFRWDFPEIYETPQLNAIAANGVKARYLKPAFPTKTFPNHYSIITGLYPDHHGIVANKFYDTTFKKLFSLAAKEKLDPAFYSGHPIWNVAEEQGIKTASFYWAGSDVAINGRHPSTWKNYDKNVGLAQRIDSALYWLQLPEQERPHFISIYLEEPDMTEHEFGPVSPQTRAKVFTVDSLVGVLWKGIQQLPIASKINLIVLSDHGLAPVSKERAVRLQDYVPSHWLALPTMGSPVVFLKAKPGYRDSIAAAIKRIPNVKAYPSKKTPRRFRFGNNPRTLDFTLIADNGWSIITDPPEAIKNGNHGFDNQEKDMQAIFFATGPAFKKQYIHKPFENVHVYALIAHLLNIKAPASDANFNTIKKMLKD